MQATVISAQAGRMEVQTSANQDTFLVYSENYFPGWRARVDGQSVAVYRTDGTLLGVPIPAGEHRVVLSGGCFQNRYLTERAVRRLEASGFRAYWHQRVPPNDGGIALGQVVGARRVLEGE